MSIDLDKLKKLSIRLIAEQQRVAPEISGSVGRRGSRFA